MNDADKIMNWQHFGTDPSDIWIRIRSNQEIWIRIPDHLWLRLDALAEVCALWVQSNFCLQLVRGIFYYKCFNQLLQSLWVCSAFALFICYLIQLQFQLHGNNWNLFYSLVTRDLYYWMHAWIMLKNDFITSQIIVATVLQIRLTNL